MQENMEKLYILCGLSDLASEDIRSVLVDAAQEQGYEAICVSRYRKEGIRQYLSEHPEFRILVLQEAMQSSYPYTAEELAELMDDYHLNIVISLKKSHRANTYMKVLYTAGILNALYEEDATAENILNCILYPRTRRECRAYYHINNTADAMRAFEIIDEEQMEHYFTYLEEAIGKEELIGRFHFISDTLNQVEQLYLIDHMPFSFKQILAEDEKYQKMCRFQKKGLWGRKKKGQEEKRNRREEKSCIPMPLEGMRIDAGLVKQDSITELIDEDISDLLGFSANEKEERLNLEEFMILQEKSTEQPEQRRRHVFKDIVKQKLRTGKRKL